MNKEEVTAKVVDAVAQVQEASGQPSGHIDANVCPITDLDGFDSLSGLEATVLLSESLGHELPNDYNPFVSKDGRRALTIEEIADNLCSILAVETKNNE